MQLEKGEFQKKYSKMLNSVVPESSSKGDVVSEKGAVMKSMVSSLLGLLPRKRYSGSILLLYTPNDVFPYPKL